MIQHKMKAVTINLEPINCLRLSFQFPLYKTRFFAIDYFQSVAIFRSIHYLRNMLFRWRKPTSFTNKDNFDEENQYHFSIMEIPFAAENPYFDSKRIKNERFYFLLKNKCRRQQRNFCSVYVCFAVFECSHIFFGRLFHGLAFNAWNEIDGLSILQICVY